MWPYIIPCSNTTTTTTSATTFTDANLSTVLLPFLAINPAIFDGNSAEKDGRGDLMTPLVVPLKTQEIQTICVELLICSRKDQKDDEEGVTL